MLHPSSGQTRVARAFEYGVFPAKDSWVYSFDQRYLRDVGSE